MNTKKNKFCIVGGGTTSALVLMQILEYCKEPNITCIYDPSIPSIGVGESTSSSLSKLMQTTLNFLFENDLPEIDGTIKFANKYINFGDGDFYTSQQDPALHINSSKFSEYVFKRVKEIYDNGVTFVYDNVKSIESVNDYAIIKTNDKEIKYDYVFDCRGFPKKDELKTDDYDCSFEIPVNSVLLYSEPRFYYEQFYSETTQTKDGWMFGIPLRTRKTFGYVYNNQITPKEDAIKNFRELKQISDNIELRSLSWNVFFKRNICDGNIITLGNRLFFTEPAAALHLHSIQSLVIVFMELLGTSTYSDGNKIKSIIELESFYNNEVTLLNKIQLLLLYQTPTNIDSKFWRYAKEISTRGLIKITKEEIYKTYDIMNVQAPWAHNKRYFHEFLNGLKVNINNYI